MPPIGCIIGIPPIIIDDDEDEVVVVVVEELIMPIGCIIGIGGYIMPGMPPIIGIAGIGIPPMGIIPIPPIIGCCI